MLITYFLNSNNLLKERSEKYTFIINYIRLIEY